MKKKLDIYKKAQNSHKKNQKKIDGNPVEMTWENLHIFDD